MTAHARGAATRVRIIAAIRAYRAQHGYSPTQAELAEAVGLSRNGVRHHLRAMEADGLIAQRFNAPRSVEVL